MRWLERRSVERPKAFGPMYLPWSTFRLGPGPVVVERFEAVGALGRYLVYSRICERRYRQETLKTAIRWRVGGPRRVLPLPE